MTDHPIPDPMGSPDPERRRIELAIEVPGTVDEVWETIATGPGITSWYVPHTVEERAGGAATARFGPGPEMAIPGRVHVWEPPHRIVFGSDQLADGLAFEWLVEPKDEATCVVRLINSGFGNGMPWDDQYDDMYGGWTLFLRNLWLHRTHFPGQRATPALPVGGWNVPRDQAWRRLLTALGITEIPRAGEQLATAGDGVPPLAGTVIDVGASSLALVLDTPAPGTGLVACEGPGDGCSVSVWVYLYGPDAAAKAAEFDDLTRQWLADRGGPSAD